MSGWAATGLVLYLIIYFIYVFPIVLIVGGISCAILYLTSRLFKQKVTHRVYIILLIVISGFGFINTLNIYDYENRIYFNPKRLQEQTKQARSVNTKITKGELTRMGSQYTYTCQECNFSILIPNNWGFNQWDGVSRSGSPTDPAMYENIYVNLNTPEYIVTNSNSNTQLIQQVGISWNAAEILPSTEIYYSPSVHEIAPIFVNNVKYIVLEGVDPMQTHHNITLIPQLSKGNHIEISLGNKDSENFDKILNTVLNSITYK